MEQKKWQQDLWHFFFNKKKKNLPIDGAWTLGIEYEGREDARLNVTMATDCKKVQR